MPSMGTSVQCHEQQQHSDHHYDNPEEYAAFHDGVSPSCMLLSVGRVAIVRRAMRACQRAARGMGTFLVD